MKIKRRIERELHIPKAELYAVIANHYDLPTPSEDVEISIQDVFTDELVLTVVERFEQDVERVA